MIALYPGAYKPPHRGHFEVVKGLLNGDHKGKPYNIDNYLDAGASVLAGEEGKVEPINKVVVFIGGGVRNGLTAEESKAIWQIYAKYLGNVEIIAARKNPMFEAKDYAKAHPTENFYAVAGIRSEEDFKDLKRVTTFKNRENVEGLIIPAAEGSNVRATDFRNSILSGNLDRIIDFFPRELKREEILKIVNMLKKSIVAEMMGEDLDSFLDNWLTEDKKTNEGSSGTPIAPKSVIRSEDRQKLEYLYNYLKNLIPPSTYISFQQDRITVSLKPTNPYDDKVVYEGVDTNKLTNYIGSILEYMIEQKMNIMPLPEVKIKRDVVNAADFFGKTAYYDPNVKEVVLYVEGRHMKDVCRSFVHEMIHHIQNIEGRLGTINTSDTNEDSNLLEIEKEAYLKGNITFRNWEDKIKNEK